MVRADQITGYDPDDAEPGILRVERRSNGQWYDAALGVPIEAKEVLCHTAPTFLERVNRAVDERRASEATGLCEADFGILLTYEEGGYRG